MDQVTEVFLKNGILGAVAVALAAALVFIFTLWVNDLKSCRKRLDDKDLRHEAEIKELKHQHIEELNQAKQFYQDIIVKKEDTIKSLYEKVNTTTIDYANDLKKINTEVVGLIRDNVHTIERWTERQSNEK